MLSTKKISDSQWRMIKTMIDSGIPATEVAKKMTGLTPAMIYRKKRQWALTAYKQSFKYQDPKYKAWRATVLKRDGYSCRKCGSKGTKYNPLQADHIKPWSLFPALRFDINNGRCLCRKCHKKTPTWGKKALDYKRQTK